MLVWSTSLALVAATLLGASAPAAPAKPSPEPAASQAPAAGPDERVKRALDSLGLEYEFTKTGNFKLELPTSGKRTQLVFISNDTNKLGKVEVREVWSTAYREKGPLSAKLANELLVDSEDYILGAWQAIKFDDGETGAAFTVKLDVKTDAKTLGEVLDVVASTADEREEALTKADEY